MKPKSLILRCFAEKKDGQWTAVCVDFYLAAQSDSLNDVLQKLESQIKSYIDEALNGCDKLYSKQLLCRKAPLFQILKYYYIKTRYHLSNTRK